MSDIGVMVCGHGSRDEEAVGEFARLPKASASACPSIRWKAASWSSPRRSSATAWTSCVPPVASACSPCRACCSPPATPRTTSRQCSAPTGPVPGHGDRLRPGAGDRCQTDPTRRATASVRPSMPPATGSRPTRPFSWWSGAAPRTRMPFQRGQGHAPPVEGFGFGLGRDVLLRRHLPPGPARPRARRQARLSAHRRLSLLSLHRRLGEAHLRPQR